MEVTLGLVQMSMSDEYDSNLEKALRNIEKAADNGAQVVCLPELFTTPYFPQEEKTNAVDYSEQIPGKTTKSLSQAAKDGKIVLIGGSIFEKEGSKFYNTATVFDETGKLLGKYRKVHIPHDPSFYEQNYFSPGDAYRVFQTKYGKIAALICYDQWYPEAARTITLMGADIVLYPTAIGFVDGVEQKEGSWQDAWETVQKGHAIANGIAVAAVNRVGKEKSMRFWGGSFVSSQFGSLLAKGSNKEEVILAKIDLGLGKKVKEGWRFLYNRRPETYGKLIDQ